MTTHRPRNDHPRPSQAVLDALAGLAVATIADGAKGAGVMDAGMKPIRAGMRVCGPALTCRCPPGDNLAVHAAIKLLRPGDVLVVDGAGAIDRAILGDLVAEGAQRAGAIGAVIDGAVRDVEALAGLGFPVFARAVTPRAGGKEAIVSLAEPVEAGGVRVACGDLVVGDDDGVVVVPLDRLDAVLAACLARLEAERVTRAALADGARTWDLQKLDDTLARTGATIDWPAGTAGR